MRWSVNEEGTADICGVTRKTVRNFQAKAAIRAKTHHENTVKNVPEEGAQCDELCARLAGKRSWVGAAIGMQTLLIISVVIGARRQAMADTLAANLAMRCRYLRILLTDGWAPYYGAFLRAFGRLYTPRRKEGRGRRKKKRIKLSRTLFIGQVVKRAKKEGERWNLKQVIIRCVTEGLDHCKRFINAYGLGNTVHTIHIERWFGSLRNSVACLKRRSRSLVKTSDRLFEKVWIFTSLYNWVLPHRTLSKLGSLVTPAMAAGLASHPLGYEEYILLPVHKLGDEEIQSKIVEMGSDERMKAAKRSKRPPPDEEVLWTEEAA
jgi:transposase-like protein